MKVFEGKDKQNQQNKKITKSQSVLVLTLYTLTSVCTFSILFSGHSLTL